MKNPIANRSSAFSLVEVVIALTILALISTSILAIVAQAGNTAADLRDSDQNDEELSRFLLLLKRTVETIPDGATLELIEASETTTGLPELHLSGVVSEFTFGEFSGAAGELYIGLQAQEEFQGEPVGGGNLYQLAISHDSYAPQSTTGDDFVIAAGGDGDLQADEQGRYWLPLVDDVIAWSFRYWSDEAQDWVTEWTEVPALIELVIEDSHRPGPTRLVFELPAHLVDPSAADTTEQTAEQNAAPTQINTGTTGQNGGGDRGRGGRGDRDRGGRGDRDRDGGGRGGRN